MDLPAFVGKLLEEQDGDVLSEGIRVLSQALMGSEVAGLICAERHERTDERTAYRNGSRVGHARGHHRARHLEGAAGDVLSLALQPRRRAEHALLSVVQEAYVHGVSTRKVDDMVKALGVGWISKSEVTRICAELDTAVTAFRTRPLTGEHKAADVIGLYLDLHIVTDLRRKVMRYGKHYNKTATPIRWGCADPSLRIP